jgi:hypothetical protein
MARRLLILSFGCLLTVGGFRLTAAEPAVSFNHQIRPLLSDRCFTCHGPDENARKGKLRLDLEADSRKPLDDGWQAIKPGDPARSEVVRRILSTDPDELMPPPDSNLKLSPEEKALLEAWIAQGAQYEAHWSFIPVPEMVPVPTVASHTEVRNPIDAFVQAKLAAAGLKPAAEADRATLIRRLSFDLTGLPPSPEEVAAFIADESPGAYDRLLTRLLDSPRYGEHKAADWLDLARYADTYGYQADVEMDFSPWRDWVIAAFNQNLPYDDFITWQIAGDLLPNPTREQRLATAFNRLHRQTNEGGSIEEEFRNEYVSDRVHTFGTAFLGLTLECARCHDHKYDPVSQRDYYSLSAFFNNIDESGLYSHFTRATPNPTLALYQNGEQEREHQELKRRIAELERELAAALKPLDRIDLPALPTTEDKELPAGLQAAFRFDELEGNRSPNLVSTNAAEFHDGPQLVPGRAGQAVQFSGDNSVVCKTVGHFGRTDPFSISLRLKRTEEQDRAVVLHRSQAWTDSGSRGYELVLDHGRPFFALIHFWPGNAVAVRADRKLPLNEWVEITLTYDGSSRASGLGIYLNGRRAQTETVRDRLFREIYNRPEWGEGDAKGIHLTLGARFRDNGFKGGLIDDLRVYDRCLALPETPAELQPRLAELRTLREQENQLANSLREIMVMEEMANRRVTHLLRRGAYDAPGEEVQPTTPAGILPFDSNLPANRLGLARWLTDRRHPLTARVVVNRVWLQHFGRGLVATIEDFGSQGAQPTHPELLDWLTGWFMEGGWNVKELHRLIASSHTYRQTSRTGGELLARDPDNELLARGPKHRLSAEQLRDQALFISGLMTPDIGGRRVKPYQPAGLWEEAGTGKTYTQDKGEKLYRRSLYTFWRRTAPPPSMTTFDAPAREVCTALREPTTTPMQALVLMNDPQFIEAARVLALNLWQRHDGDLGKCLEQGFLAITSRKLDVSEGEILRRQFAGQRELFAQSPERVAQVLAIGEHPTPAELQSPDIAALTLLMSALMNYDEFVIKR